MPSGAPYCSLGGIFFAPAVFGLSDIYSGTKSLFQKSQNGLILVFQAVLSL